MRSNKGMFQDPEVGTEAHDRICAMLTGKNIGRDLLGVIGVSSLGEINVYLEKPVYTGRNNFLLGFADALIILEQEPVIIEIRPKRTSVLVEVKTGQIRLGEVLRQVNAYRDALRVDHTVLLYAQAIDHATLEAFASQKVYCIQATHDNGTFILERRFNVVEKSLEPLPELPDFNPVKKLASAKHQAFADELPPDFREQ